ncbi:MAG: DUF1700 domain-containing protein [Bacillaceae bacterium]
MNRNDYMELLRDYLRGYFSAEETEDVIRDYEEFFEMGLASGKSESEVIASLGSPKKVAKDLADELQVTKSQASLDSHSLWQRTEAYLRLKGVKVRQYLDVKVPVWKEKATNTLQSKEDNIFKKLLRFIVRTIGFVAKVALFFVIAFASLFLIGFGLLSIFTFGAGIAFFTVNVPLAFAILFGSFILIGLFLIGFEVLRALYKQLRLLSKKLTTWWRYRVKGVTTNE